MNTATYQSRVTQKGQVTIPAEFRKELGIKPRDRVRFKLEDGRVVVERIESKLRENFVSVPARPELPQDFREVRELIERAMAEDFTAETPQG